MKTEPPSSIDLWFVPSATRPTAPTAAWWAATDRPWVMLTAIPPADFSRSGPLDRLRRSAAGLLRLVTPPPACRLRYAGVRPPDPEVAAEALDRAAGLTGLAGFLDARSQPDFRPGRGVTFWESLDRHLRDLLYHPGPVALARLSRWVGAAALLARDSNPIPNPMPPGSCVAGAAALRDVLPTPSWSIPRSPGCGAGVGNWPPAVGMIADRVWESRDFSGLPVLADALEEAGCGDRLALDHLRSGGPHHRGCWVLAELRGRPGR